MSAVALVAIILTQSGAFDAKLSESEKADLRVELRQAFQDPSRFALARTPVGENFITGAMQLQIDAWQKGQAFEFGYATQDTFLWHGPYPGLTEKRRYHSYHKTYLEPRIVSFRVWTPDGVVEIPLPRVRPITDLMDSTGWVVP